MAPKSLWLLGLAAIGARSQSTTSDSSSTATSASNSQATSDDSGISYTQSIISVTGSIPTSAITGSGITYISADGQSTVSSSASFLTISGQNASSTSSSADSQITRSSKVQSLTEIIGGAASTTAGNNGTASSTSTAAGPVNTVPCNNYPEFCNRKYSNITEVCAHNSAFSIKSNAASNQKLSITDQLNDGIRMLQGETHYVNDTVYNCHSSCDLLNAGTWQSTLEELVTWLEANPYNVVTWLIVNSLYVSVDKYIPAIQNSGIMPYLYEPSYVPQFRDQWPTLGEMILSGKRVVMFMDYNANQSSVPYILNEFTHMWETPFSPVNQSFPCTQQRPPNLGPKKARDQFMYVANHNLDTAIDVGALTGSPSGDSILIPNTAYINSTNGQYDTFGQLGSMAQECKNDWDRPPNFLLVDYYNYGDPKPGSVFQVAADMNNVTYNRPCCGVKARSAAPADRTSMLALVSAVALTMILLA